MKIEKVNDYQIRCTLTSDDLADRQIKISELVYGSDKTKKLFRDMMQQANIQFGFEAEDIPLMIEAIPLNSGCLVLVITKVEDPEELDTRFSNFAPSIHDDEYDEEDSDPDNEHTSLLPDSAEDVMNLFRRMKKAGMPEKADDGTQISAQADISDSSSVSILYTFKTLTNLIRVSAILSSGIQAATSLYKDPDNGQYVLIVGKGDVEPTEFNRICNTISEYGKGQRLSRPVLAFLEEHYELIIQDHAVESLAQMA